MSQSLKANVYREKAENLENYLRFLTPKNSKKSGFGNIDIENVREVFIHDSIRRLFGDTALNTFLQNPKDQSTKSISSERRVIAKPNSIARAVDFLKKLFVTPAVELVYWVYRLRLTDREVKQQISLIKEEVDNVFSSFLLEIESQTNFQSPSFRQFPTLRELRDLRRILHCKVQYDQQIFGELEGQTLAAISGIAALLRESSPQRGEGNPFNHQLALIDRIIQECDSARQALPILQSGPMAGRVSR